MEGKSVEKNEPEGTDPEPEYYRFPIYA